MASDPVEVHSAGVGRVPRQQWGRQEFTFHLGVNSPRQGRFSSWGSLRTRLLLFFCLTPPLPQRASCWSQELLQRRASHLWSEQKGGWRGWSQPCLFLLSDTAAPPAHLPLMCALFWLASHGHKGVREGGGRDVTILGTSRVLGFLWQGRRRAKWALSLWHIHLPFSLYHSQMTLWR